MNISDLGQTLILFGVVLLLVGFLLRMGETIPFLGKLPGDIYIDKGNFKFYFPLTTSILISIVLTIVLNFFKR